MLLFLQVFFVQRKNLEDDWLIVILKNETNDSFQIQSYVQLLLFKMRSAAKKLGNENKSEIQDNYESIQECWTKRFALHSNYTTLRLQ